MTGVPPPPAIIRGATISPCGAYRYRLTRCWGPGPLLPFVMLNPSTADHEADDPTIRRCMGFAKREGFCGIVVANLYAFRATKAEALKQVSDPIGPGNSDALAALATDAAASALPIICAWGATGGLLNADRAAIDLFRRAGARLACFGLTTNGMPRHPLYVAGDEAIVAFSPEPGTGLTCRTSAPDKFFPLREKGRPIERWNVALQGLQRRFILSSNNV